MADIATKLMKSNQTYNVFLTYSSIGSVKQFSGLHKAVKERINIVLGIVCEFSPEGAWLHAVPMALNQMHAAWIQSAALVAKRLVL